MITETDRLSREFFTEAACANADCLELPFSYFEEYALKFIELETSSFEDGLILLVVAKSLVSAELVARQNRHLASTLEQLETVNQQLDWISNAAFALMEKGLQIVTKNTDVPTAPFQYVPAELTPILQ
ncbi:hypothetical protein [Ahrensia sp. 13_GOM-1096m]|uniref:hypothetical protein n=1 Tax=Ahrensia sp. 13_GOM-1096m TaxID=1380380 RepID=UPI00047C529C|nr:hypothetical protein [Ahrensia sp. 13_GOM-1096m]